LFTDTFLSPLVSIPVTPMVTGMTHFIFHIHSVSIF